MKLLIDILSKSTYDLDLFYAYSLSISSLIQTSKLSLFLYIYTVYRVTTRMQKSCDISSCPRNVYSNIYT